MKNIKILALLLIGSSMFAGEKLINKNLLAQDGVKHGLVYREAATGKRYLKGLDGKKTYLNELDEHIDGQRKVVAHEDRTAGMRRTPKDVRDHRLDGQKVY